MAFIIKDFMTCFGVKLPGAYGKVSSPVITEIPGVVRDASGNIIKQYPMTYNLDVYADNNARLNGLAPIESRKENTVYDINSKDNIYIQCYTRTKSLPEFKDAVDC